MYVEDIAGQPLGMTVSPDKLLELEQGFQGQREQVHAWLLRNREALSMVPPPGNDPCSRDTVEFLSRNGQTAIDAAEAYLEQLSVVVTKLRESAVSYGLVEEEQVAEFRREPT